MAVVVTRYFGGVLLGTGGLVRAYSKAVQEGLAASKVILKQKGIALKITTDYTGLGKIQYIAGERNIPVLDSEYTDKVVMKLLVPVQDVGSVQKAITEGTNGRAGIEKDQELYYACCLLYTSHILHRGCSGFVHPVLYKYSIHRCTQDSVPVCGYNL